MQVSKNIYKYSAKIIYFKCNLMLIAIFHKLKSVAE